MSLFIQINTDEDIDKWMKPLDCDIRPSYSLSDIKGSYFEITEEDDEFTGKEFYKAAEEAGAVPLNELDEESDTCIFMYGTPTRVSLESPRGYVSEMGCDPEDYDLSDDEDCSEYASFNIYELDEDGDELDCIGTEATEEAAIAVCDNYGSPAHVVIVPVDEDDDDVREWFEYSCDYDMYEVIYTNDEAENLNESLKKSRRSKNRVKEVCKSDKLSLDEIHYIAEKLQETYPEAKCVEKVIEYDTKSRFEREPRHVKYTVEVVTIPTPLGEMELDYIPGEWIWVITSPDGNIVNTKNDYAETALKAVKKEYDRLTKEYGHLDEDEEDVSDAAHALKLVMQKLDYKYNYPGETTVLKDDVLVLDTDVGKFQVKYNPGGYEYILEYSGYNREFTTSVGTSEEAADIIEETFNKEADEAVEEYGNEDHSMDFDDEDSPYYLGGGKG